jgi:hypothetical protein
MQTPDLIWNLHRRIFGDIRRRPASLGQQSIEAFNRQHLLPKHMTELPRRLLSNLLKTRQMHALRNFPLQARDRPVSYAAGIDELKIA